MPVRPPLPAASVLHVVVAAPCCRIGAYVDTAGWIAEIRFLPPWHETMAATDAPGRQFEDALLRYLEAPRAPLAALPLRRHGSPFQRRVWDAIDAIPCGQTRSYGELATQLGSHARAIGQACGANPFPIFTPCHRVIGRKGAGGFAHARDGWLIATKQWLLMHEGAL